VAALTGAQGNSTGLVGTPEQVADAMLAYADLGIDHFLIRGFNPLADAIAYGEHLIPLVHSKHAARQQRPWRWPVERSISHGNRSRSPRCRPGATPRCHQPRRMGGACRSRSLLPHQRDP
jgi:hypothetical protein